MLISKYTDKLGKTNVAIVFDKKVAKTCKNQDFARITFNEDFKVGVDKKKQLNLSDVFKLDNIPNNTKKDESK